MEEEKGYKECSIFPTLLMTLLSRFCTSSRRLYQLSDNEVTSPTKKQLCYIFKQQTIKCSVGLKRLVEEYSVLFKACR